MLQITRKAGETIVIGNARVVVLAVTGKQVRLGVSAPRKIPIYREEISESFTRKLKTVVDETSTGADEIDRLMT
jgi:carbon storage regulator